MLNLEQTEPEIVALIEVVKTQAIQRLQSGQTHNLGSYLANAGSAIQSLNAAMTSMAKMNRHESKHVPFPSWDTANI